MKDEIQAAFGIILRKYRNQRNLSQEKLAELANLDRTYISQIERGLKSPSIKALIALARALHIGAYVLVQEMENALHNPPIQEKRDQIGENRTKRTID